MEGCVVGENLEFRLNFWEAHDWPVFSPVILQR